MHTTLAIQGRSLEKCILCLAIISIVVGFSCSMLNRENTILVGKPECFLFPPASPRAAAPPGAPQNLLATGGNAQVMLTWGVPLTNGGAAITNYNVFRGTIPASEILFTTIGNVTTYPDLSVVEGTTYYYKVSAINGDGESSQSNEASATPVFPPSAPQNLLATAGNGQNVLTWQVPLSNGTSPILNYRIYRDTSSLGEVFYMTVGIVTTYTDLGVTDGHTYYYKVSAMNGVGEGLESSEASATPRFVPGSPRNLQVVAGNEHLDISWQTPASNGNSLILGYKVYRGTITTGETLYLSLGNQTTFIDWGVNPGHKYFYQVSALNIVGEGLACGEKDSTPVGVPEAPRGFHVSRSAGYVVLEWLVPANNGGLAITNYTIRRGTAPGAEIFLITVGNVTVFTDTAVTLGITYYYTTSAVNSIGDGQLSNENGITPASVPGVPRNLNVTRSNREVLLSWAAPSTVCGAEITSYRIYRGTSAGNEEYLATVLNVTRYTDIDLQDDQTYYYKITAVDEVGEGDASEEESIEPSSIVDLFPPFLQNLIGILIIIAGDITAIGAAISAKKKKLRETSTPKHAIDGEYHTGFGDCVTLNVGTEENTVAAGDHTHEAEETSIPSGSIMMFSGDTPPAGWLLCDGSELSKKDYSTLFAAIGTNFGGDGKERFNLPDFRNKMFPGNKQGAIIQSAENDESSAIKINYIIKE